MVVYDVLVFGAGQVAAGYDSPDKETILTHAHAILKHKGLNLLGFYDINAEAAANAAKKWGGQAFEQPVKADVVAVCTTDDAHLLSVSQAVNLSPKLIVLEKPIARSIDDMRAIKELAQGIPVLVNFSRRFVPCFRRLAIEAGGFGTFLTGSGQYGKGFIHNGSHMVDLLRMIVGDVISVEIVDEINDFYSDDPTKSAVLRFENGCFHMCGVDCRNYTLFEIDLCFEKARVRVLDSGAKVDIYKPVPSEKYAGYINLALQDTVYPEMDMAMMCLYDNAFNHLANGEPLVLPLSVAYTEVMYQV